MSPTLKPVESIECYTKKYNNIPVDKFKNPLETSTKIPNRNSSLRNSNKHRNGGIEIVQKNDIIQVQTFTNENAAPNNNGEEISIESDSRFFDKFMMLPTPLKEDFELHPLEIETREILEHLGIDAEMLEKHTENGPRSEVIGIYRIVIMRLKVSQDKERAKELELNGINVSSYPSSKSSSAKSNGHSSAASRKKNAKCAILWES